MKNILILAALIASSLISRAGEISVGTNGVYGAITSEGSSRGLYGYEAYTGYHLGDKNAHTVKLSVSQLSTGNFDTNTGMSAIKANENIEALAIRFGYNYKFPITDSGKTGIYLGANAGAVKVDKSLNGSAIIDAKGGTQAFDGHGSDTTYIVGAEAGIDINLTEGLYFSIGVEANAVGATSYNMDIEGAGRATINGGTSSVFLGKAGISYRF